MWTSAPRGRTVATATPSASTRWAVTSAVARPTIPTAL